MPKEGNVNLINVTLIFTEEEANGLIRTALWVDYIHIYTSRTCSSLLSSQSLHVETTNIILHILNEYNEIPCIQNQWMQCSYWVYFLFLRFYLNDIPLLNIWEDFEKFLFERQRGIEKTYTHHNRNFHDGYLWSIYDILNQTKSQGSKFWSTSGLFLCAIRAMVSLISYFNFDINLNVI